MSKYRLGQKVWVIKINKFKEEPSKYSVRQDGITIEELSILGVSDYKVCFNDPWFTSLDNDDREGYVKQKKYYNYIGDINVNVNTGNHVLGDGVFATLYSLEKPSKKILKKMYGAIKVKVEKEFGFLANGVDIWNWIEEFKID